jgi:hypothetical protein
MIKKSFFDAISIASMERMHSQMIAWILSADCEAISQDSKSELLAGMCGISAHELGRLEKGGGLTEWHHIDVVVKTEKCVVFIENKIKSSQGPGQLSRYNRVIDERGSEILQGRDKKRLLLSFVGERPEEDSWRGLAYSDLVRQLDSAVLAARPNEDATIVTTYVASLKRLTRVVDSFRENPARFETVFKEGSSSRAKKSELSLARTIHERDRFSLCGPRRSVRACGSESELASGRPHCGATARHSCASAVCRL